MEGLAGKLQPLLAFTFAVINATSPVFLQAVNASPASLCSAISLEGYGRVRGRGGFQAGFEGASGGVRGVPGGFEGSQVRWALHARAPSAPCRGAHARALPAPSLAPF